MSHRVTTLTKPEEQASICVIEDDPVIARIIERVASQTGLRVFVSASAMAAMEVIVRERPRLVIADVNLPDLKGPDLIENLQKNGVSSPVLFISGDSSLQTVDTSLRITGASFLPKPFTAEELREAIWSGLAQR